MESLQSKTTDESKVCLPNQLIFNEILTKLPTTKLVCFKSVSKQWYKEISDPYFAKHHFHQCKSQPPVFINTPIRERMSELYYLSKENNGDSMEIMDSCDGLLVVSLRRCLPELFIYNPLINKAWKIPSALSPHSPGFIHKYTQSKIVFDCTINRYKIITWYFAQRATDNGVSMGPRRFQYFKVAVKSFVLDQSQVMDGSGGCWRVVEIPEDIVKVELKAFRVYLIKQKIYWLYSGMFLFVMDIASEVVKKITIPRIENLSYTQSMIIEIKGLMYLICRHEDSHCYTAWIIEEDEEETNLVELHEKKIEPMHCGCGGSGSSGDPCECSEPRDTSVYLKEILIFEDIEQVALADWSTYNDKIKHYNTLVDLVPVISELGLSNEK